MSRRLWPSLGGGGEPERKGAIDRRHGAGPHYAFAGVPYTAPLGSVDLDRVVKDCYERDVWVWRAVDARAKNASRLDVRIMDGRGKGAKEIENHRLSILLNRKANRYESAQAFRYRLHCLLDLSVTKGVFVEVIEDGMGQPRFLHLLNPLHTWPVPHPETFVSHFFMQLPTGETFDLPVYRRGHGGGVLWIKRPHPTDPYRSTSWLEAAQLTVELDYYARLFNRNFLMNDGRPGGVLSVKSEDGIDPADAAVLQGRMSGGPGVAGKVTIMEADALEYIDLATTAREAQYVEGRQMTQREILIAAGTPLSVIGDASGRTFDNADAEFEGFWRNEEVPELELVGSYWEELTEGGIEDDSEVVTYDYDSVYVLGRDARAEEARAQVEWDKGLITLDEYRERTGKDPKNLPGTRVLWLTSGKAPVGDEKDVTALLTQGMDKSQPQLPPGQQPAALEAGPSGNPSGTGDDADAGGAFPEVIDGEIVDDSEQQTKALKALDDGYLAKRRREHAQLIDRYESAVATELAGLFRRQEDVVLARLKGTKARKHTRHWTYATAPAGELKALDSAYVIERRRWVEELVNAVAGVVLAAFGAAGQAAIKQLGSGQSFDPGKAAGEVVARTVRLIAEGFDARAGRLQEIITAADEQGASIEEIAEQVREAYLSASTWSQVSSRQVVGAMNAASLIGATQAGALRKRWLCVAPDTEVIASGVLEASRRSYVGPLVRVRTASGREVTVTPNHHVLTGRGWIAANEVKSGDYLFHVVGVDPARALDVQGRPPRIGELIDTAMQSEPAKVRTVPGGVDLDGYGIDGEVEVAPADSDLRAHLLPPGSESVRDLALKATDETLRAFAFDGPSGSLLGRDRAPEEPLGHASASRFPDSGGFPGDAVASSLPERPCPDARLIENPADSRLGATDPGADLPDALTGLIRPDDVLDVEVIAFSGHVYDLSTEGGWYTAGGLIVHNCTDDERTRPSHKAAEGQVVGIGEPFEVGDAELQFPHDPTGPVGEVVNCRCTMLYQLGRKTPKQQEDDLDADLAAFDAAEESGWKARPRVGSFGAANVRFEPARHPRDQHGRFLDVPDVHLADGSNGVAVAQDSHGNVTVAKADGDVVVVPARDLGAGQAPTPQARQPPTEESHVERVSREATERATAAATPSPEDRLAEMEFELEDVNAEIDDLTDQLDDLDPDSPEYGQTDDEIDRLYVVAAELDREVRKLRGPRTATPRPAVPKTFDPITFQSPAETPVRWQLARLPDGRVGQVASNPRDDGTIDVLIDGQVVSTDRDALKQASPPVPVPYTGTRPDSAERHVWCARGHRHWGAAGAAGVLIRHTDADGTPRYLMQLRGPHVNQPGTWSTPGGALKVGETPEVGALREAVEEMGQIPADLTVADVSTDQHGGWGYSTVTLDSPTLFTPVPGRHDGEQIVARWFTAEQIDELPLHPGFEKTWRGGGTDPAGPPDVEIQFRGVPQDTDDLADPVLAQVRFPRPPKTYDGSPDRSDPARRLKRRAGRAYELAAGYQAANGGTLVHGAYGENGTAWVLRDDGTVFEAASGHRMPRDTFERIYDPTERIRYDKPNAAAAAIRYGNYGPWDADPDSTATFSALDERLVNFKPDRNLADPAQTVELAQLLPDAEYQAYSETPFLAEMHRRMGVDDPLDLPVEEYMRRRDELFTDQPLVEVPFDQVTVTQRVVNGQRVGQIVADPETGGTKPQHFVRHMGRTYVMNGHHRVAAQIAGGDTSAVGHVLDLDAAGYRGEPEPLIADTLEAAAYLGSYGRHVARSILRPDPERQHGEYADHLRRMVREEPDELLRTLEQDPDVARWLAAQEASVAALFAQHGLDVEPIGGPLVEPDKSGTTGDGAKARAMIPTLLELIDQGMSPEDAKKEWHRLYHNARFRVRGARIKAEKAAAAAKIADLNGSGDIPEELPHVVTEEEIGASADPLAAIEAAYGALVKADLIGEVGAPDPKALYTLNYADYKALKDAGYPAGPGAVRPGKTWADHMKGVTDGVSVPVVGVRIQGHTVPHGTARNIGGMPYLLEHEPTAMPEEIESGFKSMTWAWDKTAKRVKPSMRQHQKGFAWCKGPNPADAQLSVKKGFEFKSAATGGDGTTTFWDTKPSTDIVSHEFGHNVDSGAAHSGSPAVWLSDLAAGAQPEQPSDADPGTPGVVDNWETTRKIDATHSHYFAELLATEESTLQEVRGTHHPITLGSENGPTDYGQTNEREDFAESVRLYLKDRALGRLGYIAPGKTDPLTGKTVGTNIRFVDLYPARASYLDRVFGHEPVAGTEWELERTNAIVEQLFATGLDDSPTGIASWPSLNDLAEQHAVTTRVAANARNDVLDQLKAEKAKAEAAQQAEEEAQATAKLYAEAAAAAEAELAKLQFEAPPKVPAGDPGGLSKTEMKRIRNNTAWTKWNAKQEKTKKLPGGPYDNSLEGVTGLQVAARSAIDKEGDAGSALLRIHLKDGSVRYYRVEKDHLTPSTDFDRYYLPGTVTDSHNKPVPEASLAVTYADEVERVEHVVKIGMTDQDAQLLADQYAKNAIADALIKAGVADPPGTPKPEQDDAARKKALAAIAAEKARIAGEYGPEQTTEVAMTGGLSDGKTVYSISDVQEVAEINDLTGTSYPMLMWEDVAGNRFRGTPTSLSANGGGVILNNANGTFEVNGQMTGGVWVPAASVDPGGMQRIDLNIAKPGSLRTLDKPARTAQEAVAAANQYEAFELAKLDASTPQPISAEQLKVIAEHKAAILASAGPGTMQYVVARGEALRDEAGELIRVPNPLGSGNPVIARRYHRSDLRFPKGQELQWETHDGTVHHGIFRQRRLKDPQHPAMVVQPIDDDGKPAGKLIEVRAEDIVSHKLQRVLGRKSKEQAELEAEVYEKNALEWAAKPAGAGAKAPTTPTVNGQARKAGEGFIRAAGLTKHPLASAQGGNVGQAKANIAAELASRLNNPTDWETFRAYRIGLKNSVGEGLVAGADKYGKVPGDPGAFADVPDAERQRILDQECSNRIGMWASTSGDSNPWAVMMLRAISEEFDCGGQWAPGDLQNTGWGGAINQSTFDKAWPHARAFYRRFVRAQYEHTQEEFAKEGITEIAGYRGMRNKGTAGWRHALGVQDASVTGTMKPGNSWATNLEIARRFSTNNDTGRIVAATVPVTRIIGTARTGFGCYNEWEFVVMPGPGQYVVYRYGDVIPAV